MDDQTPDDQIAVESVAFDAPLHAMAFAVASNLAYRLRHDVGGEGFHFQTPPAHIAGTGVAMRRAGRFSPGHPLPAERATRGTPTS